MDVPDLPSTANDLFLPLDQFLHSESLLLQETIDIIMLDIRQLLDAARGSIPATPEVRDLIGDVSQQRVPLVWQKQSYPSAVPLIR